MMLRSEDDDDDDADGSDKCTSLGQHVYLIPLLYSETGVLDNK